MSQVRVLVGTRKGALSSSRRTASAKIGDVSGPHFCRLGAVPTSKGSPANPKSHLCFAVQRLVRADYSALRRRRQKPGRSQGRRRAKKRTLSHRGPPPKGESNKFVYDTSRRRPGKPLTTHQWYDGTPASVGVSKPRLASRTVAHRSGHRLCRSRRRGPYFRSTDGGQNWQELAALRGHGHRASLAARSRWACAFTPLFWTPANPKRIYIAISAAGRFPYRRRRQVPGSQSTKVCIPNIFPDPNAEVGHCVHHVAMHPSRPRTSSLCKKHWDVYGAAATLGDSWNEVSGNLPDRLRLRHRCSRPTSPETNLRRAHQERRGSTSPLDGKLRVYRSKERRQTSGKRLPRACRKATAT